MTRILIVDDHPLYLNALSALVQIYFRNAHILRAGSASEAKTIVRDHNRIDWIFVNYFLPDCNGIELLKDLCQLICNAHIVLNSGNDRVELVVEALDQGARGFLSKSGSAADVFKCLDKISAGDIYLAPDMQKQVRNYRSTIQEEKKRISHQISKRQKEVLLLLSAGYSNAEIATALGISPHTVKDHVSNIMQLFNADNRVHCIAEARQLGLIC